ncbi:hypothetical protein ACHQM5_015594 [Ranunculus cassubicifolius]
MSDYSENLNVSRSIRDAPPAHYTFKIQSFSLISENLIEKYESNVFESGGYKWKLVLYPKGDEKMNVKDHISLYIAISETDSFHTGREVYATFKLFLFDQVRDKYLTVEDEGKIVRRFHAAKTEWGFSQFIPLTTFNDPSNGYLLKNTCVFGAEVFVRNNTGQGECLSMVESPVISSYTWKVTEFSKLAQDSYYSDSITAGNHKWKISLYPKGDGVAVKNKFISLYVKFDDLKLPSGKKVYAKFVLRIRDQIIGKNVQLQATCWFTDLAWGWAKFMELSVVNDPKRGFLVKNTLIIEADVTILGFVDSFT